MLNPASLRMDRLPPIPEGAVSFALGSFRNADVREALGRFGHQSNPSIARFLRPPKPRLPK